MQRGERQTTREESKVKVTALREQFRATSKPGKPAKAAKHVKNAPVRNRPNVDRHKFKGGHHEEPVDRREEEMAKAEKLSQIHHTTSLLKSKPQNNRFKEHKEKKKWGLLLQLVVVGIIAGGATVALDPSILPEEIRTADWEGMKYQFDVWLQNLGD
jgi:hypothetical protein